MTHEELIENWERDCQLDRSQLQTAIYNIPLLHAKYLRVLQSYKIRMRKEVMNFDSLRQVKTRYFNGQMTKEELDTYEWKQYPYTKPTKSGLDTLLAGDKDLQRVAEKMEYLKILIETSESILKEIHQMGFLVRTMVDHQKFEAGVM